MYWLVLKLFTYFEYVNCQSCATHRFSSLHHKIVDGWCSRATFVFVEYSVYEIYDFITTHMVLQDAAQVIYWKTL